MYNSLLRKGTRISLRSKVNESLITGIRLIDSLLPIGLGQRQLILGDRSTGKTSIFMFIIISSYIFNYIGSVDGFGIKRLFSLYIGICLNLTKISKLILNIIFNHFLLIICSHTSSTALLNYFIPFIGLTISERLRDRNYNVLICFDDLSKHSKAFRQISLILGNIPSRDAFPASIFNVHSSLLERCGKLNYIYGLGSITAFPIIETINSDITDYIATNLISITDGQFYMSKNLFIDNVRPAIDSGLSVSRIGSASQCKLIKIISSGLKNELTNLRLVTNLNSIDYIKLNSLNNIFYQNHLFVSSLTITIFLLLIYKNFLIYFNNGLTLNIIYKLLILLFNDYIYLSYIILISKHYYSIYIYSFISYYTYNLIQFYNNIKSNKLNCNNIS